MDLGTSFVPRVLERLPFVLAGLVAVYTQKSWRNLDVLTKVLTVEDEVFIPL